MGYIEKHKYKKHLGQNFIKDTKVLKSILSCANNIEGSYILEIGCGLGSLTKEILLQKPKKLFVIEKDIELTPILEKIKNTNENFDYTIDDALLFKYESIPFWGTKKINIIANLPYNISVPLLFLWLNKHHINHIETLILMFQKEVAERIVAPHSSKKYGKLSIQTQIKATTEIKLEVDKSLFYPIPKVDSSIVKIVPHIHTKNKMLDYHQIMLDHILNIAFSQRRKKISNTMKQYIEELKNINVNLDSRPEEIPINKYAELSLILYQKSQII